MGDLLKYINEYALVLIPVLYVVGMVFKGLGFIPDKYIPLILLVFGIMGALGLNGIGIDSVIQGILVTGVTVYTNQTVKQLNKNE